MDIQKFEKITRKFNGTIKSEIQQGSEQEVITHRIDGEKGIACLTLNPVTNDFSIEFAEEDAGWSTTGPIEKALSEWQRAAESTAPKQWYQRWGVLTAIGVGTAAVVAIIAYAMSDDVTVDVEDIVSDLEPQA